MKINLIEMEAFLRGKCLPGDMKVNETNAEYLVRKFSELNEQLEESQREFRSADITMQNLEAKCEKLAAENAGLKNPDNWLSQSDYGYEASEVATSNGASEDEALRAGMIAIINRIETPVTDAFLAEVRAQAKSEVIEWLNAEITAIDTMYRGDPSYEHDAYWMKSNVLDVVELARKAFAAQLRKGVQS